MPLDPSMIHSAARIIGDVPHDKLIVGTKREPIGTGFLVTVNSETLPDLRYGYVVTAHHVLDDQPNIEVQPPNPFSNGELYEPVPVDDWRQPLANVDLAVAQFPGRADRSYQALSCETHLPTEFTVTPRLGARVFYIGILTPLDRPMVRSGTIGALDQVGLKHDGGYEYPAHLVDCRSYDGFSGSPCLVVQTFADLEPSKLPQWLMPGQALPPLGDMSYVARLCGMFTQHLTEKNERLASKYGVGVMLRSEEIREALMSEKLRKERRQQDEEFQKQKTEGPGLKNASVKSDADSEFDRFEDLTRRLVNTPKSEVDEERKGDS